MVRRVRGTCYLAPLREGGSLPGIVEADDDGTYVAKFRGAGQGTPALVAELVVGELARHLGIRVPELVLLEFDPRIARHEPDEEIQDLLLASAGLNLGMDFLPGALGYDGVRVRPPAHEAATIHWLDAFTANIDRTWRNTNLLVWHGEVWAIDHGASLVFQHAWPPRASWASRTYDLSGHALAPVAAELSPTDLARLHAELAERLTPTTITHVLDHVPEDWLLALPAARGDGSDAATWRRRYVDYLLARLEEHRAWAVSPAGASA